MNYLMKEKHPSSTHAYSCIVSWGSLEDYLTDCDLVGDKGHGKPNTKKMRQPDLSILERMEKYQTTLNESEFISTRIRSWDVAGGSLDVPTYLSGAPEHFSRISYKQGKDIKIVFSPEVHRSSSSEAIYYRGAALLSLVDSLESLGNRVELWLGWDNTVPGAGKYESRIIAKKSSDYLNVASLAAVCCDTDFLRTCEFNLIQHFLPLAGGKVGINNGITLAGDVVISGRYDEMHHFNSLDSCKAWIDGIKQKLQNREGSL